MALIASSDDWSVRALDTLLQARGHRVVHAPTGAAAVEQARSARPDMIIVVAPLPDLDGVTLCEALRRDILITPGIPIMGIAWAVVTREQRLSWLRAGAWDLVGYPFDPEELMLKVDRYVEARRGARRPGGEPFVDEASGLYTERGVKRRTHELVAEAMRLHTALACVVFGTELARDQRHRGGDALSRTEVRGRVGRVLRTQARLSDTVGWWNDADVAVLAPATDAAGAAQLAQRLVQAIEMALHTDRPGGPESVSRSVVCAGYEAVSDAHATPIDAEDLLASAGAALARARASGNGNPIHRFQGEP